MSRTPPDTSTPPAKRTFSLLRLFWRRPIERAVEQVSRQFTNLTSGPARGKRSEIHHCLQQAFDSKPGMRKSLVHLAHVESALRRIGDESLAVTPVGVLGKAFNQLDILMSVSPPSRGLTLLSRRMAQLLGNKRADDAGVGISDASLDDYDQAVRDSDMAELAAS